jgi:hypothetical protein
VGNKLVAFGPNLNRVLDIHRLDHITEGLCRPLDRPGPWVFSVVREEGRRPREDEACATYS